MEITKDSYAEEQKKLKKILEEKPERLGHYVYVLADPTKKNKQIFYVGKGQGLRVLAHIYEAFKKHELNTEEDKEEYFSKKIKRILDIHNAGKKVILRIVHHCLTNEHALLLESAIIDLLGDFKNVDKQAIAELTNLKEGYDSRNGICDIHTLERKLKATKELKIPSDKKILLIKITGVDIDNIDIKERVSKAWRLNRERADKADYVAAYNGGLIVGLYERPFNWKECKGDKNSTTTRYCFEPQEVERPDIRKQYIGHWVPVKKGAKNPIMYLGDWK